MLRSREIMDAVAAHAQTSGLFVNTATYEPKSAPGKGMYVSVWFDRLAPIDEGGLATTSAALVLHVRIQRDMLASPMGSIDLDLLDAVDYLMAAYSGDFQLGIDNVRYIDLKGQHGERLAAAGGYVSQDNRMYRVATITLPIIINDAWEQSHG